MQNSKQSTMVHTFLLQQGWPCWGLGGDKAYVKLEYKTIQNQKCP